MSGWQKVGREGSISSNGGFHVWSGRPQWTKSFCAEFRAAPYRQNLDRAGPPAKAYLPPGDQSSNRQAARPQVAAKAFRARDRGSRGQLPGRPPRPQRGLAARDAKALRGALQFRLPPGYCWNEIGQIEMDPDE